MPALPRICTFEIRFLDIYHLTIRMVNNMELQKHIENEKTGISYMLQGDYYLPELALPKDMETRPIGRYGRLHGEYIITHQRIAYTELLTTGKLHSYLQDINEQAQMMMMFG